MRVKKSGGETLRVPRKSAFFERVNVGYREECSEAGHTPEHHGILADEVCEADGPWIHENDFDVEDDEEHGDEVKLNAEAWCAFSDGEHSTFVRSFLSLAIGAFFTEQDAEPEGGDSEANRDNGLENDWKIIS